MTKQRIFIAVIGTVLTFFIVRGLLGFLTGDFAYSVIPGWHTTILTPQTTLTILTTILLVVTLIVVGLYKLISKALQAIWTRLKNQ